MTLTNHRRQQHDQLDANTGKKRVRGDDQVDDGAAAADSDAPVDGSDEKRDSSGRSDDAPAAKSTRREIDGEQGEAVIDNMSVLRLFQSKRAADQAAAARRMQILREACRAQLSSSDLVLHILDWIEVPLSIERLYDLGARASIFGRFRGDSERRCVLLFRSCRADASWLALLCRSRSELLVLAAKQTRRLSLRIDPSSLDGDTVLLR